MRVSTPFQFDTMSARVRDAQTEFVRRQNQVSTGRRFERASEDPLAATLSLTTRSLKARFEQFDKNLRGAKDYLAHSEQAFAETNTLAQQAYTLAIQAASSAVDANTRQGIAQQIAQLQERLVSIANTQGASGQYVFGGHQSDTPPFAASAGTLTFSGDNQPIRAEVRTGEYMPVNVTGASTLFTDLYNALETLRANVQSGDVTALSNTDIPALQASQRAFNGQRAEVGARLRSVAAYEADNARRIDDFTKKVSDLEEVDLAEAITRYQQAEQAYTAALQVSAQGMRLSLMDFMR